MLLHRIAALKIYTNIIPWIFIDCSEIIFLPNSFRFSYPNIWCSSGQTQAGFRPFILVDHNFWFCRGCIMKLSIGFSSYYFASYISKYASILRIWVGSFMMSETTPNEKSWALMHILWKLKIERDSLTFIFHIINSLKECVNWFLERGIAEKGNNHWFSFCTLKRECSSL